MFINMEDKTAFIAVGSEFAKDWLNRRLYGRIAGVLSQVVDQDIEVEFVAAARDRVLPGA